MEHQSATPQCILCEGSATLLYTKNDPDRGALHYYHCSGPCELIFLEPNQHLSAEEEKERYDLHNNDPNDQGYLEFLRRLTNELVPRLQPGAHGLDFGSGPGPAMRTILEPLGHTVAEYDYFYAPDTGVLERRYNFITATEVFEHLHSPQNVIAQLMDMLLPGGVLAVMTETITDPERFASWWYHTDPTHLCFYSEQTFRWIAERWGVALDLPRKNVALFSSPA